MTSNRPQATERMSPIDLDKTLKEIRERLENDKSQKFFGPGHFDPNK